MVSRKERDRMDDLFRAMQKRVDNQRAALTRVLAIQIEMRAALHEIASLDGESHGGDRARIAIERTDALAAATEAEARDLLSRTTYEEEEEG